MKLISAAFDNSRLIIGIIVFNNLNRKLNVPDTRSTINMTISATGIFDELFLPTLGLLFTSSLAVVSLAHFKSNSLRSTLQTVEVTIFYTLAAISFLLQVKSSWFVDFLSQFKLVEQTYSMTKNFG